MIVTQEQIVSAMQHYEDRHIRQKGPLNGVDLPKECGRLCDLLGAMWFHNELTAQIPDESPLAALINEAKP